MIIILWNGRYAAYTIFRQSQFHSGAVARVLPTTGQPTKGLSNPRTCKIDRKLGLMVSNSVTNRTGEAASGHQTWMVSYKIPEVNGGFVRWQKSSNYGWGKDSCLTMGLSARKREPGPGTPFSWEPWEQNPFGVGGKTTFSDSSPNPTNCRNHQ